MEFVSLCVCLLVKGKAVPLLAWSGPEGSRKLRLLDYMTKAQDGGKVVSLTHWPPLPPGNGIYSPFFPLQNAVCFIILTYLVPVLFTFYIQVC